jgi:sigma54-dependent transcription regulator
MCARLRVFWDVACMIVGSRYRKRVPPGRAVRGRSEWRESTPAASSLQLNGRARNQKKLDGGAIIDSLVFCSHLAAAMQCAGRRLFGVRRREKERTNERMEGEQMQLGMQEGSPQFICPVTSGRSGSWRFPRHLQQS